MTNTITKNFTEVLATEFPTLTLQNKAKTWNVDFLNGRVHVLGTKYSFKSDTYVLYLPKRTYALAEAHLSDELKSQFTYHEKWGMPYELKGDLKLMLSTLPALKKALLPEKKEAEKTEKKETKTRTSKKNTSNKK